MIDKVNVKVDFIIEREFYYGNKEYRLIEANNFQNKYSDTIATLCADEPIRPGLYITFGCEKHFMIIHNMAWIGGRPNEIFIEFNDERNRLSDSFYVTRPKGARDVKDALWEATKYKGFATYKVIDKSYEEQI